MIQFAMSLPFKYLIKIADKDVQVYYNEENNHQRKKQLHSMFTLRLKQSPHL